MEMSTLYLIEIEVESDLNNDQLADEVQRFIHRVNPLSEEYEVSIQEVNTDLQ